MKSNRSKSAGNLKRILVPVDFSRPSGRAFAAAVSFAREIGAEILALHVVAPVRRRKKSPTPAPDPRAAGKQELAEFLDAQSFDGVRVTPSVTAGVAYDQICRAAKSWRADLIVIATRGLTGLKHFLLGSTAERVARYATVPVLALRGQGNTITPDEFSSASLRNILVPVDFSKASLHATLHALGLARQYESKLILLHVVERPRVSRWPGNLELYRQTRAAATEQLKELADSTTKAWPNSKILLRAGHVGEIIEQVAANTQTNLVVLGSHGHGRLRRLFLGSVAERTVQCAPCSVLLVRAKS